VELSATRPEMSFEDDLGFRDREDDRRSAPKHGEIPEKGISFREEKEALPFRRTVVDSDKL
jgi:hypothetical protein